MMVRARIAAAAIAVAAVILPCAAQAMEWQQVSNLPKGLNLPKGIQLDVLEIEPGDTYAEARAKLDKWLKESPNAPDDKAIGEVKSIFKMPTAHAYVDSPEYIGGVNVTLGTTGAPRIRDRLMAKFSAPSSGHQLVGLWRDIEYNAQAEQPRISELLARLKAKFKAEPQAYDYYGRVLEVRFQYKEGKLFVPQYPATCLIFDASMNQQPETIVLMNGNRDCDVMLKIMITYGISNDHAKRIIFTLSDTYRAKANSAADQKFFNAYVQAYRAKTGGAGPRL